MVKIPGTSLARNHRNHQLQTPPPTATEKKATPHHHFYPNTIHQPAVLYDKMSTPPSNIVTSPLTGNKRKQPDPPEEPESEDVVVSTSLLSTIPLSLPERKKEKTDSPIETTKATAVLEETSSVVAATLPETSSIAPVTTSTSATTLAEENKAVAVGASKEKKGEAEPTVSKVDIVSGDKDNNSTSKEDAAKSAEAPSSSSSSGVNVDVEMKDVEETNDESKRVEETEAAIPETANTTKNSEEVTTKSDTDVLMKDAEKLVESDGKTNNNAQVPDKEVDKMENVETKITTENETKDSKQEEIVPNKIDGKFNWDIIRAKLSSQNIQIIFGTLTELRDDFELLHSTEYPSVLATLVPIFGNLLNTLPCSPPDNPYSQSSGIAQNNQFSSNQYIHRVRHGIMELCNSFPCNEVLRPYVVKVMAMAIGVLKKDYEENALLASKIIVELHKNYRQLLTDHTEPYLNFVLSSYRNLSSNVQKNLTWKDSDQSKVTPDYALKSEMSFRILTECPLTVILIFQLYPKFIKSYLMQLLPLMMDALGQRPPPPPSSSSLQLRSTVKKDESIKDGSKEGSNTNSDLQAQKEAIYTQLYYKRAREFLSAQVKTLTFVTFLLSRYGEQMKPHEDNLATNVLNLFQMCPREAIATRKDLLLALRHIFATDFRSGFFKHIDLLLDDRVLIGKHKQSEHTHLRVEAYGALATLIPHVCSKLTLIQISRVVLLYSRVLHDASMNLPLKSQMMSINLLLCMVDTVFQNTEERASFGRDILYRIFENLVWKMRHLSQNGTYKATTMKVNINGSSTGSTPQPLADDKKENNEMFRNRIAQMYGDQSLENQDTISNVKSLIKMILPGFKKLIWCINSYGAQREKIKRGKSESDKSKTSMTNQHYSSWYEEMAMQTMSTNEQKLVDNCLVWSLDAIQIFNDDSSESSEKPAKSATTFRLALDLLASALAVMDSFSFQRVVGPRVGMIFEAVVRDPDAIVIVQKFLLHSTNISPTFASCLIKYLMQNVRYLSISQEKDESSQVSTVERKAEVMQQLFEILFSSLAVYPKNEFVVRPHLQTLIATCLRHATNNEEILWPGINLKILKKLFHAIAGGKFEESYKEILPLLSPLLNGLYRISLQAKNKVVKNVIIDICLTIPARLSSHLPHLPLLLRVIVSALQTNDGELINLG